MNKERSVQERMKSLHAPISGTSKDPAIRRALRRRDAIGMTLYTMRPVPTGELQPGAFAFPGENGMSELVQRICLVGFDTSHSGEPVEGQPGIVVAGRHTADFAPASKWTIDADGQPVPPADPDATFVGTWAELLFDDQGRIVERCDHFPGPEPVDRDLLDKAVQAAIDDIELRGRKKGWRAIPNERFPTEYHEAYNKLRNVMDDRPQVADVIAELCISKSTFYTSLKETGEHWPPTE